MNLQNIYLVNKNEILFSTFKYIYLSYEMVESMGLLPKDLYSSSEFNYSNKPHNVAVETNSTK